MVEISKENYGQYSSDNYGAHSIRLRVGSLELYFSYDTVIAFAFPGRSLRISENLWGATTGKHLNWINPDKSRRIPREQFEQELNEVLKECGLIVP